MTYVLYDLDESIRALLKRELPEDYVGDSAPTPVEIIFAPPDAQQITSPAIDLFLYDIRENLELRSNEWRVTRNGDGTATREPPPVRIDCSYLVTAWPVVPEQSADDTPFQDEHRLLSAVMAVLLRYPKLPPDVLQGSLQNQEPPWRALAARQANLQSMGEYWQAMGGKPKATLNYTVTVSMPVHQEMQSLPLVTQTRLGGSDDG